MNALNLIHEYHQIIFRILNQLIDTKPSAIEQRLSLFEKLKRNFGLLEIITERYFYPQLKKNPETLSLALDTCAELHFADDIIEQLSAIPCDEEEWSAGIHVLKENIEMYFTEEHKLLQRVANDFDVTELEKLSEKVYKEKQQLH